ncbi:hypothetical protein ES703_16062 [subsurface metagenome]
MINDKKSNKKSNNINYNIDEEDIFKSLSHKIRVVLVNNLIVLFKYF